MRHLAPGYPPLRPGGRNAVKCEEPPDDDYLPALPCANRRWVCLLRELWSRVVASPAAIIPHASASEQRRPPAHTCVATPVYAARRSAQQWPERWPDGGAGTAVRTTLAPPIITLRTVNGRRFRLDGKSEYTIGRASPEQPRPDVDLSEAHGLEAGVSREHLKIRVDADGVFVQDLVSTNETVQNGYRLMPQQWYPLRDGDELRLGAIILYVSIEQPRP